MGEWGVNQSSKMKPGEAGVTQQETTGHGGADAANLLGNILSYTTKYLYEGRYPILSYPVLYRKSYPISLGTYARFPHFFPFQYESPHRWSSS